MDFSPFLHSLFLAVNAKIETSLHQLGVFFGAILAPWGSLGRPSLVLSPPMRENTTIWGMGDLLAAFWVCSGLHLGRFGVQWQPFAGQNGCKFGSKS